MLHRLHRSAGVHLRACVLWPWALCCAFSQAVVLVNCKVFLIAKLLMLLLHIYKRSSQTVRYKRSIKSEVPRIGPLNHAIDVLGLLVH